MATINFAPSKERCCGCRFKTSTRIVGFVGLILAIMQIVLASRWIETLDQYDYCDGKDSGFVRLMEFWSRGIFVTAVVLGVVALLCQLLLLIGNEMERSGCFGPWVMFNSFEIFAIILLIVVFAILGSATLGFYMFAAICVKGAMIIPVFKRQDEIEAKRACHVVRADRPEIRIQPRASAVGASSQAGFNQVHLSAMPHDQAGLMQVNDRAASDQAGFDQPAVSTMSTTDEACIPSNALHDPPPPYASLGII